MSMTPAGLPRRLCVGDAGHVFVLDDDSALCDSLAWLLESVGIHARCFTDPERFLAEFTERPPDGPACLVLDVRMPRFNGFQVQEYLERADIPVAVVFVSAHGDIPMSVRAMRNGAVDFLEKPYDPQAMLEVVQRALQTAREGFAAHKERREVEARLSPLSAREREILALVTRGVPSKEIARELSISLKTVDAHRARIREKTGAETLGALVGEMLRSGARRSLS